MSQLSLSWNSYKNDLHSGISSLQQRQEFVDMTLAADGHFVKVHQIIISLASPYLKELIKTAPCPHPVLFLNEVSFKTLGLLLEYIYSGEVHVNRENLKDFIRAAKALHIKGLLDLEFSQNNDYIKESNLIFEKLESKVTPGTPMNVKYNQTIESNADPLVDLTKHNFEQDSSRPEVISQDICSDINEDDCNNLMRKDHRFLPKQVRTKVNLTANRTPEPSIQYTLSNQGCIQMILNRYIYYFRYNYKRNNTRLWRCVDYNNIKCPASVTTKGDVVVQRIGVHKHSFHDKKILKKINNGKIYTAIKDAIEKGNELKTRVEPSSIKNSDNAR